MKSKLKELLADYLGVEIEDIDDSDSFSQDLHISALDLTDFVNSLKNHGFDTSTIELGDIETFEDLAGALDLHE
jgi:acyl carrier protein